MEGVVLSDPRDVTKFSIQTLSINMFRRFNMSSGVSSGQIYDQLDAGSKHIRLLQVQRNSSGQLSCTMKTFPLAYTMETYQTFQPFLAISYTWGRPQLSDRIQLNGQPFKVRSNLKNVLEFIASKDKRCHSTYEDLSSSSSLAAQDVGTGAGSGDAQERPDFNPRTDVHMHEVLMDYYLLGKDVSGIGRCNPGGPWWWIDAVSSRPPLPMRRY